MHYINKDLKVPLFDAIDRMSIMMLKRDRLRDEKDRTSVENEYVFYQKVLDSYRNDDGIEVKQEWIDNMKGINAQIWDVEADIRLNKKKGLALDAVGRLWLKLRDFNNIRNSVKDTIMSEINIDFYEVPEHTVSGSSLRLPLHETIDRLTVSMLKTERLREDKNYPSFEKEYAFYKKILDSYRNDGIEIKEEWITGMKEINGTVWNMESDVRQGREQGSTEEDLGRRVLELRELSKIRVAHKNKIAEAVGLNFYEVKTETT